ncbi:hypothetical protein PQQ51_21965 [Paraburkholderia xenovorans]|uniref:hypothetical protein n=1 Tax=Paraburkholderia xenovorans TaxID=36873 RepID=UPI0038BD488C
MTTPLLIVLVVLFIASGSVMLVSLLGRDRGINFHDLDNESTVPPDRLDVLRKPWVFYTATVVLLGTAAVYLWWKAHLSD